MSAVKKFASSFSVLGLSHRTAPLEIRELLALEGEVIDELCRSLLRQEGCEGALILSTCNRVEVYTVAENVEQTRQIIQRELQTRLNQIHADDLFYWYVGQRAVEHLIRVTSGLDSMILGEPQIAGQVKEAYSRAVKLGVTDTLLNQLFHRAFRIAKRIRTETEIQSQPVSVPYTAVLLAEQIFGELEKKKVLLIGAGQMSELAAEHLVERNIERLLIANRNLERARSLAQRFSGEVISFEEYPQHLHEVDIVLASTSAREVLLHAEQARESMKQRKNRPVVFIDLGVPRDIDPSINELMNAYLFDIDDLQQVVDDNLEERQKAAQAAEHIIHEEVNHLSDYLSSRDLSPVISNLLSHMNDIRRGELDKIYQQCSDLDEGERQTIERYTEGMLKKLLHPALDWLKQSPNELSPMERTKLIRRLFGLKDTDNQE